jgi:hypothetical protein
MKGFKGKISFYKNTEFGYLATAHHVSSRGSGAIFGDDYVYLGVSVDVDVTFPDSRQLEIESIEKRMEKERAESQQRLNMMMGRIQQLQALEHD